jgi:hypothetical protein
MFNVFQINKRSFREVLDDHLWGLLNEGPTMMDFEDQGSLAEDRPPFCAILAIFALRRSFTFHVI